MPTTGGGVVIDLSINITTIIAVVVWLVTLAVAWTKFGGRIDMLEFRVTNIEKATEKIADALERQNTNERELAVMREQMASLLREQSLLHDTVESLRKGEGWITGRRVGIDGEYPGKG